MDDTYALPQISEARFPQLRAMMRAEPDFPSTYADWLALWRRRRMEEERRGQNVVFVNIEPDGFAHFCASFTPPLPHRWGALTKYVLSVAAVEAAR